MGMVCAMVAVSDANIDSVLKHPPLVWRAVAPDDPEAFEDAVADSGQRSFMDKLLGKKVPEVNIKLANPDEDMFSADLDKAWQGIHYLFTGTAFEGDPPLNFIAVGGADIGDIDVGYGPARAFSSVEVRAIDAALSSLSTDDLRRRFAPNEMMELQIYPEIWDRDPADDDTLGYLMENIDGLRAFLKKAVQQHRGMIVYLC